MRIGLFGGTFNPIHVGHLRSVLEVADGFPLDQCHLIPAAIPPHKDAGQMVAAEARLEMLRLALAGQNKLKVSDVEINRSGLSYTIDTVQHFMTRLPESARLFLIVGLDAFLELDTWKANRDLLRSVGLIVMSRPLPDLQRVSERWQAIQDYLTGTFSAEYTGSPARSVFVHPRWKPVHVFNVTLLDISSSVIRETIRSGRSVQYLLPPAVADYIKNRGLYA